MICLCRHCLLRPGCQEASLAVSTKRAVDGSLRRISRGPCRQYAALLHQGEHGRWAVRIGPRGTHHKLIPNNNEQQCRAKRDLISQTWLLFPHKRNRLCHYQNEDPPCRTDLSDQSPIATVEHHHSSRPGSSPYMAQFVQIMSSRLEPPHNAREG